MMAAGDGNPTTAVKTTGCEETDTTVLHQEGAEILVHRQKESEETGMMMVAMVVAVGTEGVAAVVPTSAIEEALSHEEEEGMSLVVIGVSRANHPLVVLEVLEAHHNPSRTSPRSR